MLKSKPLRMSFDAAWVILFALISSSCAHVQIDDDEWCASAGSLGASCFHTISGSTRDLDAETWKNEEFGQICTHDLAGHEGETFAKLKAAIEKLCQISKRCTYADRQALDQFFQNAESAQRKAMRK